MTMRCAPFLLFPVLLAAQDFRGDISGSVIDAKTQERLPAVNIQLMELPSIGTVTDPNGSFYLTAVPVGTYSLKATIVGYEGVILTNVVVSTGRSTKVLVRLFERAVEVGDVTVRGEYFDRGSRLSPLSMNSYDRADVKRQPGSAMDVQRVIQNLPGVASSTDNINELIVRGGAPYENLTIMESMEIPSINHYPNQFNSAGPINMVNIDLVEDVQFSSGGFPAQYGDKMSSVMDITIREGERNRAFASNSGFNIAGIGTVLEGRLSEGQGSWILSARQSLLEFVDKVVGMSALSLTAIPKYWDTQGKLVYDLSPTHKLVLNGMFGNSRIYLQGDPKEANVRRANQIDSTSVQDVNVHSWQYVFGASLKSLWGKVGYSVLTLYAAGNQYNVDARDDFTRRVYGPTGNVLDYSTLTSRTVFSNRSDEEYLAAKYELFYQLHPRHEVLAGAQVQTSNHWTNRAYFASDTARYDFNRDGVFDTGPIALPDGNIVNNMRFGDASKMYAYLSDRMGLANRLHFTAGLRYDYFTYSRQGEFSPRLSLSYDLFPPTTTISVAAGTYWQTQPFPYYADRRNIGYNREISNARAAHVVASMQHILGDGIKMSLEAYYKRFQNIAVSEQFVYSAIDTFRSDHVLAIGERRSYGIEVFLQKKQVTNYYGTISVTLSKTEDFDPRIPKRVDSYPSQYDYPVIVNLVGGSVVKGFRSWLNDAPFFLRYPSYLLPFSDEMELSARYRYQTGGVYTPRQFTKYVQKREGGIKWSQGAWVDSRDVNAARYPDYSRLDLQWISRFYLRNWNINVYIALQNALNTKNVFYYMYRSDGTVDAAYQFSFFPVGGIEIEF